MGVDKMSVSLARSLSDAVRDAAEQSGETLSGWMADAAQTKLRARALDDFLDAWESENGAITDGELHDAVAKLGLATDPPGVFNLVKLTTSQASHQELVATIAHIIEGGHTVLVTDIDASEMARLRESNEHISFESAHLRTGHLAK